MGTARQSLSSLTAPERVPRSHLIGSGWDTGPRLNQLLWPGDTVSPDWPAQSHTPPLEPNVEPTYPKPDMEQEQGGEPPGDVRCSVCQTCRRSGRWAGKHTDCPLHTLDTLGKACGGLLGPETMKRAPAKCPQCPTLYLKATWINPQESPISFLAFYR